MKGREARRVAVVREKAEKILHEKTETLHKLPKHDVERLVHELGEHEIELETQNEELRQTQQELERSRRRYAELYDFAPAGYFTFDENGIILELNQTAALLLGSDKRTLLKSSFSWLIADQAEKEQFRALLAEALSAKTGKAMEIKLRKKDHAVMHASLQFVLSHEPAAEHGSCSAVVTDISEREQLEEALRRSREQYRLLFNRSPVPIWVVDPQTLAVLEVNDAAVGHYGYTREEFAGLTLEHISTDDEFQQFQRATKQRERIEGRTQTNHRKKNGEIIDVDVRYEEIRFKGRSAVLSTIVDITDLKRAQQDRERLIVELQRSNRELQQFAYVASHDLQEPLRTVSSYVDLLALKYKGKLDQSADKYISYAVEGVNRMASLISDLLAFSRVSTQGNPFKPADMETVFGRAQGNLRLSLRDGNAIITRDDLPVVNGDYAQLVQLLQNLMGNAIKFRKKGVQPRIRVSAQRRKNEWVFGVHDNGIGIEPRFFERIFGIFQRLHTRDEYPGTGVGLSICRRIVERHGGRIWVESQPGEGSSFYFTLPAG